MTKRRLNISSLVYIIARYVERCPWGSRFERDKQIVGTGLCARPCYSTKCAVFPSHKRIDTNSNFSCTNWQLRLHPSSQLPVHCCSALHRPSPRFPCCRSISKQQICRRFLRSVLACHSGQFYLCVYGRSWHAYRKHSVLRWDKIRHTVDIRCGWSLRPWWVDFRGDDMGPYEEFIHWSQCEKFLENYGSRKASSCVDQITLARWAVLFSVIIVLVARITHEADTVFLGPLLSSMFFTRYCTLSISRISHPAPLPFRLSF